MLNKNFEIIFVIFVSFFSLCVYLSHNLLTPLAQLLVCDDFNCKQLKHTIYNFCH